MYFDRRLPSRLLLGLMGAHSLAPAFRAFGRGLVSIFTLHRFADPQLGVVGHELRTPLAGLPVALYQSGTQIELSTTDANGLASFTRMIGAARPELVALADGGRSGIVSSVWDPHHDTKSESGGLAAHR